MKTIKYFLNLTSNKLLNYSKTPQLDAEILLAHAIKKNKTYLHAHPEYQLTTDEEKIFSQWIERRKQGEPVAYIIGEKEFWSLMFQVNPHVLIPRPETELLVEKVLALFPVNSAIKLADLGTGSGAIALAVASERPHWSITATDCSTEALKVAKQNAQSLKVNNVQFYQGDWCGALSDKDYDVILSNPPYIDPADSCLTEKDMQAEPRSALVASQCGLGDIEKIIASVKGYLKPGGWLLLEHGAMQKNQVHSLFLSYNYQDVTHFSDLAGKDRVSAGRV